MGVAVSKAQFLNLQSKEQQLAQKDALINQLIRDNEILKATIQRKNVVDLFISHALTGAVAGYSTKPHIPAEIPELAKQIVDLTLQATDQLLTRLENSSKEVELKADEAVTEILKEKEAEAEIKKETTAGLELPN